MTKNDKSFVEELIDIIWLLPLDDVHQTFGYMMREMATQKDEKSRLAVARVLYLIYLEIGRRLEGKRRLKNKGPVVFPRETEQAPPVRHGDLTHRPFAHLNVEPKSPMKEGGEDGQDR